MDITIYPRKCSAGTCLPLSGFPGTSGHRLQGSRIRLKAGTSLCKKDNPDKPLFMVTGGIWETNPASKYAKMEYWPLLTAEQAISATEPLDLVTQKTGYALAVITLSDKGYCGQREDTAGPLCLDMLMATIPAALGRLFLIPDEADELCGLLANLAYMQKYDLICTCGGTGVGPRDITPQTTARLLDMPLPGFAQAMMAHSLAITPRAAISRACAGIMGKCLVFNLPGSEKAARENLAPILDVMEHTLAKLNGDASDCAATGQQPVASWQA